MFSLSLQVYVADNVGKNKTLDDDGTATSRGIFDYWERARAATFVGEIEK